MEKRKRGVISDVGSEDEEIAVVIQKNKASIPFTEKERREEKHAQKQIGVDPRGEEVIAVVTEGIRNKYEWFLCILD